MKAAYGYVRQVKKHLSTPIAIIEVEIIAEAYKEAVQLLDGQLVLVTVHGDMGGAYRILDSKELEQTEPGPEKIQKRFIDLKPSAQAAIRCKDERFRNWWKVGLTENECVEWVRSYCSVASRAELDVPGKAQDLWKILSNQYWAETRYPEQM